MTHVEQARRATWRPIMEAVAQTVGFASALHRAALEARLGRDPEGTRFASLAARLPAHDRRRLLDRITELESERTNAGCAA